MTGSDDPVTGPPADAPRPARPLPAALRLAYVGAGLVCVGLAYLGVILPGLPATPWVLLASYCFARSSPRLHRWLRGSRVFGLLIRDWEDHRGIRRPVKVVAVLLVVTVVTLSMTFGPLPVAAKWAVGGLAAVGVTVILFVVPTVRRGPRG